MNIKYWFIESDVWWYSDISLLCDGCLMVGIRLWLTSAKRYFGYTSGLDRASSRWFLLYIAAKAGWLSKARK